MNKIKRWDVQFPYSEYPKWYRMCDTKDVEKLEASHADIFEALQTLTLVIGLTPIAGNKEALQQAFGIARSAIAKAEGKVTP